ncbi:glycosyltransferase family 2 protein [Cribrihabitans neustonicus]|uniref:glycosyltransferase family 2 protein n=1 Tax=Cribrihabitans neustonicus TaxID=1429085 RepID=UPI003B59AAAA
MSPDATAAEAPPAVSVLIPACNEEACINGCLDALFASDPLPGGATGEVLVLANGCTDATADVSRAVKPPAGWRLRVLEQADSGKPNALNAGDQAARGRVLVYLDADVRVEPALIPLIAAALAGTAPRYASGRPVVAPAQSALTRAYARAWRRLPFFAQPAPGFGLFAMNRSGRARWGEWPDIISDDTFARLQFRADERLEVPARYAWPMVEGFRNQVRVRRRQDKGVAEIAALYPELLANDSKARASPAELFRRLAADPAASLVYLLVALAVKSPLFASRDIWTRGR